MWNSSSDRQWRVYLSGGRRTPPVVSLKYLGVELSRAIDFGYGPVMIERYQYTSVDYEAREASAQYCGLARHDLRTKFDPARLR